MPQCGGWWEEPGKRTSALYDEVYRAVNTAGNLSEALLEEMTGWQRTSRALGKGKGTWKARQEILSENKISLA